MPLITRRTISENFLERVRSTPLITGYRFKPVDPEIGPPNQWKSVSFQEFFNECREVALGLMSLDLNPGDRCILISNTRFEWSLCDMAILGCRGITVPVYPSNITEDAVFVIDHSEAKVAILEDGKQLEKIIQARIKNPNSLPLLKKIIVIDPSAQVVAARFPELQLNVITLKNLKELGRNEESRRPDQFETHLREAAPDDLITICYTSGTTGTPKGVMITQDNMVSVMEDCVAAFGHLIRAENEVTLSFLPFSHILGKAESLAIYTFGWTEYFAESVDKLPLNLEEVRPTAIFSVPRVFEKTYSKILSAVEAAPSLRRFLFHKAMKVGRAYYSSIWNGNRPTPQQTAQYKLAQKVVFSQIKKKFGGRLEFALCGGAPLPKEMGEFFQIVGIPILEGYGLTETSAPISLNLPEDLRFGTVGRPLPEVEVKISEDGEILINSRKVFKGYYKMPTETEQALQGGWFHTGDIGYLDADGFLRITDRKKDLIITSAGKNIAPQKIENLAKLDKLISQFIVHGDGRHYLTALVTLERELVIQFASQNQIFFSSYAELLKHPKIMNWVQKIIHQLNTHLSSYETIKKFIILSQDFTVESGELTPSLKVKRKVISKRYQAELNALYAQEDSRP